MELEGPLAARLEATSRQRAPRARGRAASSRAKRALDIVVAASALALLGVLLVLVSAVIKLWDGGPVLVRQRLIGRNGVPFASLKFRTHAIGTTTGACDGRETGAVPHGTPFGRVLAETGVDELPQLVNVIRGDMSLVGPRAITAEEAARYGASIADYEAVRPGLTGLWQYRLDGDPKMADRRSVALNRDYVRRWSLRRDLAIMIRTVPAVMSVRRASGRSGLPGRNARSVGE